MTQIPLFPLGTVLFPGGRLQLQIFEQRYLDLVRESFRNDTGFGMAWILSGQEVAQPGVELPSLGVRGTYARIVDWNPAPSSLLGITVEGKTSFQINDCFEKSNRLVMGNIEMLPALPAEPLTQQWAPMLKVLTKLEPHPPIQRMGLTIDYDDAWQVGRVLAQILPLEPAFKYELLEIDDIGQFMERLGEFVHGLAS